MYMTCGAWTSLASVKQVQSGLRGNLRSSEYGTGPTRHTFWKDGVSSGSVVPFAVFFLCHFASSPFLSAAESQLFDIIRRTS